MLRRKPLLLILLVGLAAALSAGALAGWHWHTHNKVTAAAAPSAGAPAAEAPASDVVLDAEQREYIWQIEHHVLMLGKHWFHDFGAAWARADAAALGRMLAADFKGELLQEPVREELKTPFATITRLKDAGSKPVAVTRDGFVKFLLKHRALFSAPPRVKVFAKTLLPDVRNQIEGAWHGIGVARLWGEAGAGKPAEVVLYFEFRLPRPDRAVPAGGWLKQTRVLQAQTSTANSFLLTDVTRARGIDAAVLHDNWKSERKISGTGGVYLCDFNRDGLLDLLVVDVNSLHLYQGKQNGRFEDVTAATRLPILPPPDHHGSYAAFADLDGDGWEDLLLWGSVYRNEQGRFFKDCTTLCNLRLDPGVTGVVIGDFDRDGKVDLYLTRPGVGKTESWLDGKSGADRGNQLWRNLGNWQFEDVTEVSGTGGGQRSVFSAVWLDANDDGWPDLYIPNEFGHGVLLVNQANGTFREHTIGKLPGDFGTMGLACGDVNNDGKVDLYLANMYSKTGARIIGNVKPGTYAEDIMAKMRRFVSGSQLYLNQGDLTFTPVAQSWQMNDIGWAYGPTLLDLDNDGFLDVFATSGFMSFDRSEPDG